MNKFKVGDQVTVVDNSWSRLICGPPSKGNRVRRYKPDGSIHCFKIVAVDGLIPINMSNTANTLLASTTYIDMLVVINACNIEPYQVPIDVRFTSAGQDVTAKLSDKSKRRILQTHLRRCGV